METGVNFKMVQQKSEVLEIHINLPALVLS